MVMKVSPHDGEERRQTCMATCCCLDVHGRDSVVDWMLHSDNSNEQPSLLQRLICQCGPEMRTANDIINVPEIRSLSGVTLQSAPPDWPTKGSLHTLKYCVFDRETRVAEQQVFGGFGKLSSVGLWTEPAGKCHWDFLMNLARLCNYTYHYEFSEDWREMKINIKANLCCLCFGLPPCMPAWCTVPDCIVKVRLIRGSLPRRGI